MGRRRTGRLPGGVGRLHRGHRDTGELHQRARPADRAADARRRREPARRRADPAARRHSAVRRRRRRVLVRRTRRRHDRHQRPLLPEHPRPGDVQRRAVRPAHRVELEEHVLVQAGVARGSRARHSRHVRRAPGHRHRLRRQRPGPAVDRRDGRMDAHRLVREPVRPDRRPRDVQQAVRHPRGLVDGSNRRGDHGAVPRSRRADR